MKRYVDWAWFSAFALVFIAACITWLMPGCSSTPEIPAPTAKQSAKDRQLARGLRPHPVTPTAPSHKLDARSPQQIAQAACTRADGSWACSGVKPALFGAGSTRGCPACTVAQWYTDPANTTTCASDSNTCTSATCSTGGVGPCVTANEIIARWGTNAPLLLQNTTITLLSAETAAQENVFLNPMTAQGVYFAVVGTPLLVANVTLGTVTAKSRTGAGGHLLTSTGFTATGLAVNQLVVNTTSGKASKAWIYALSAGTATLTQPMSPLTAAADASNFPSALSTEVDTWAHNDTVSVYTVPLFNLKGLQPVGGDTPASTQGGTAWLQNVHVPDTAGSPGNSYFTIGTPNGVPIWTVDDLFDTNVIIAGTLGGGIAGGFANNTFFNGGAEVSDATVAGGGVPTTGFGNFITLHEFAALDGDFVAFDATANEMAFIGNVYVSDILSIFNAGLLKIDSSWGYGGPALYGPAACSVQDAGRLMKIDGTWASALLFSGALTLSGVATGTKFVSGTYTAGVSITPANLDSFLGLQNPLTGARYSND